MRYKRVREISKQLFENAFSMIIIFDKDGTIMDLNDKAKTQLGYENEVVLITDVFHSGFRYTMNGIEYTENKQNKVAYRKNETCFPVELSVIIENTKDNFLGVCLALNSSQKIAAIKDMEKAKEEAEHVMEIRNEFVSNVTHELRTPVNGIKGITAALYETSLTQEQQGLLSVIERCCSNMSNIINDLLDFSKLESGKFSLEEREFCFGEFLEKAVEASLPTINDKGLTLQISVSSDIPDRLIGDELRLNQIINNLLSNSIKFTSIGQIVIEVTKTAEDGNGEIELFFMVRDTGIGIAKEDMDKLFKSFSQVDATITRQFGGTGLGLSITKQLVELMKGDIFVDSERGKGSTFAFSVCLHQADYEDGLNYELKSDSSHYDDLQKKSVKSLFSDEALHFHFSKDGSDSYDYNKIYVFGTAENRGEITKHMEKLILCIEMDNWEKAEEFAKKIKLLVGEHSVKLKREIFRLELSLRKEAKEQSKYLYEELEILMEQSFEE